MDGFIASIQLAYGDLQSPDYRRVSDVQQGEPYQGLLARLREFGDVEDLSDTNYDVCFTFRCGDVVLLISAVGPYLLVVTEGGRIIDECDRPAVAAAIECGLRRVTYREAISLIDFFDIDAGTSASALYRALFTLADRDWLAELGGCG